VSLPILVDPDWEERSLCRRPGIDPEIFYPPNSRHADARRAKALCRVCIAQTRCLAEALSRPGESGIWGGTDEEQRAALLQRSRTRRSRR